MRRAQVLLLVMVLAVGLVTVAGCGDASKAKEYAENGDELSLRLDEYTDDAGFDALDFLSRLGVEFLDTGGVSSETVIDEALNQIANLTAEGEKAIAEYEKILGLSGVDDYKQYAKYRVTAVESEIVVLAALGDLLDRLASAPEGTSLKDTVSDWARDSTGAAVAAVEAFTNSTDAANLKKEKGL